MLSILSLIFWAILVVVTMKYVVFMMRADNKGEGGILALYPHQSMLRIPCLNQCFSRKDPKYFFDSIDP